MTAIVPRWGLLLAMALSATACPELEPDPPKNSEKLSNELSPNAAIQPAPMTGKDSRAGRASRDAGAADGASDAGPQRPPDPLREDRPLPTDSSLPPEVMGHTVVAHFIWHDIAPPPSAPEADPRVRADLAKRAALNVRMLLTPRGRLNLRLLSAVFPLGEGTELRARTDRLGYVLVWPNASRYRSVPSGALRALLGERRLDVVPLVSSEIENLDPGSLLGLATRRVRVSTSYGDLELDQTEHANFGGGGALLCRLLVELVGGESLPLCHNHQLPLRASFHWEGGGGLGFLVTRVGPQEKLDRLDLLVPPYDSRFSPGTYPPRSKAIFSGGQLRALRSREPETLQPAGPGLIARNFTTATLALLVDGIPTHWVPPNESVHLRELRAGRYSIAWRDFLGRTSITAKATDVPGESLAGTPPDAGTL